MSPGTALFSRAVLYELEHGVWSVIPLRPDTWQPIQLCYRIRGLGGSVYNAYLGLKEVEKPERNSPSSRPPVLCIWLHFFDISLVEKKK